MYRTSLPGKPSGQTEGMDLESALFIMDLAEASSDQNVIACPRRTLTSDTGGVEPSDTQEIAVYW